tara:strand:- start:431 stop:778 length:348 start_codon:yes stop_codon:yes gene_type:complete
MLKKIIILKEDKPDIGKTSGEIIDILDENTFEGEEVVKDGFICSRIYVDITDELYEKLLKRDVKFRPAIQGDTFHQDLFVNRTDTTQNKIEPYLLDMNGGGNFGVLTKFNSMDAA